MKHLFVPHKLALLAKEKGFEGRCFGYYNQNKEIKLISTHRGEPWYFVLDEGEIEVPIYQQIVDWFRENHKIAIEVQLHCGEYDILFKKVTRNMPGTQTSQSYKRDSIHGFYNYKQALDKSIEEAFKLI